MRLRDLGGRGKRGGNNVSGGGRRAKRGGGGRREGRMGEVYRVGQITYLFFMAEQQMVS